MYRWKLLDHNLCSLCGKFKESYSHFFADCEQTRSIWNDVANLIKNISRENIVMNTRTILLNQISSNPTSVVNLLCLITKKYLYSQRCLGKTPNFIDLKAYFWSVENIEHYIAKKNNKLPKHYRKWRPATSDAETRQNLANNDDYIHDYINES